MTIDTRETITTRIPGFTLRFASAADVPLILAFIKELAEYEQLSEEVVADEALLAVTLFGKRRTAEVVIGQYQGEPVSFALFFHSFSTFLGRPGLYLEDLYVRPQARGRGIGEVMLAFLARLAEERGCGRVEWSVLNWNRPAISLYKKLGAVPMDEWTLYRVSGQALEQLARRF
ncbi:MAG TPA: GNAT family N-acetyltransferase [Candidatus Competibacteraceae bacterium]|nr:GNAT family N-acetyltransferase [Candidatus Competibacteraceae bacterium]